MNSLAFKDARKWAAHATPEQRQAIKWAFSYHSRQLHNGADLLAACLVAESICGLEDRDQFMREFDTAFDAGSALCVSQFIGDNEWDQYVDKTFAVVKRVLPEFKQQIAMPPPLNQPRL